MKKILVIDDEELIRNLLRQVLEREDYSVSTAENGLFAFKLLKDVEFDLVITDLVMPDKEGLEIILELRKTKPHIPVIAISGGARTNVESYLDVAKQFGAKFTLTKPFNKSEIVDAVKSCLE